MSDWVFISALELPCRVGVHAWERQVQQMLYLDVELPWDMGPAARGDDLALALDYSAVADALRRWAGESAFALIETLAEHLATQLLAQFALAEVRLRLHKPGAVTGAESLGVSIQRRAVP